MTATSGSGDGAVPRGADRLAEVVLDTVAVEEILRLVVDAALVDIGTATGASIVVDRHGNGDGVVASAGVERLAPVEHACGRGPGVEAMRRSEWSHASVASGASQWPEFAAAAEAAAVASVLAFPLRADGRTLGSLVLYADAEGAFGPAEIRRAEALAARAGVILANALAVEAARDANLHLRGSLATRGVIGQAQGLLMARHHCSGDEAFALLRQSSQLSNRKLRDVAAEIVAEHERAAGP